MLPIVAISILQTSSPVPPAQAEPLSLGQALERFRKEGFDLLIAEAAIGSAQGDLQIGSALPLPTLSLSAGRTLGYDSAAAGPGASNQAYSAALSDSNALSDLLWGKRQLRIKVAEAALQAAKLNRRDAERTLATLLKQQYVQAVLAELGLELTGQVQASAQRTQELVETRLKAGVVAEVDLIRARVAALEAAQNRDAARQSLEAARGSLAFLLGYRGQPPTFQLERRFEHPEPAPALPVDALLLSEAKRNRPDLLAAAAQEQRAEAGLELARRNRIPDLTWSIGVAQEGTGQNAIQPRTYTLGLSLPLPSPRRQRGEVAKAQADRRTQELLKAKAEAQVAQDVRAAAAAFEAGTGRLKRMQTELLPSARRAYELVRFQYEKGATSLLDVLDAQRTFMATQAEYLQNLTDYWNASFQLDQALGKERNP